ncbi:DUF5360 family protein [Priestia megaterium]|uniref:DUF5360 family protein n=1 Tax=Priestia megaterium TaxID=1404 RepID=UPI00352A14FC
MTFRSGLQAIAYWALMKDFNLTWWAFNLHLMIYPLFFIKLFIKDNSNQKKHLSR